MDDERTKIIDYLVSTTALLKMSTDIWNRTYFNKFTTDDLKAMRNDIDNYIMKQLKHDLVKEFKECKEGSLSYNLIKAFLPKDLVNRGIDDFRANADIYYQQLEQQFTQMFAEMNNQNEL